jgi:hypothetical protein
MPLVLPLTASPRSRLPHHLTWLPPSTTRAPLTARHTWPERLVTSENITSHRRVWGLGFWVLGFGFRETLGWVV